MCKWSPGCPTGTEWEGKACSSRVICCQDMVVAPCSSCCYTWWGSLPSAWPDPCCCSLQWHSSPLTFPAWLCVTEHMLGSSPVFTALAAARGLQFTWRHLLEAATMFILTASFATDTRWQAVTRCQRLMILVSSLTESLWPVHIHRWGCATWVRPGINPGQCPI